MAICALDTLLESLREAVRAADEAIRHRRDALRHDDDDEAHALHVQVPASPYPGAPLEPVVVPLRLFRDRRDVRIALLSLEFDGRFRLHKLGGNRRPQLVIDLGRPRFRWFTRAQAHRIRISYRSVDAWLPHIEIDGRAVTLPASAPSGGEP
jgi:hypothetical protein